MPDEIVEQPVETTETESTQTQPEEAATETTETEEQPKGTAEVTEEVQEPTQTEEPLPPPPPEKKKFVLKVDGQDVEKEYTEDEERAELQKAIAFSKKQQALAEFEKTHQQDLSIAQQVKTDPTFMKAQLARLQGYDPSIVFANPTPPPDWLKETNPDAWAQAKADHDFTVRAKSSIDQAFNSYVQMTSETNNRTVFEKAKMHFDLSDDQYNRLTAHVRNKVMPDRMGLYSFEDVETQYWALFGRENAAAEKLKTSESINASLQRGAKRTPAKPAGTKPEKLPPDVEEARRFRQWLKESTSP